MASILFHSAPPTEGFPYENKTPTMTLLVTLAGVFKIDVE